MPKPTLVAEKTAPRAAGMHHGLIVSTPGRPHGRVWSDPRPPPRLAPATLVMDPKADRGGARRAEVEGEERIRADDGDLVDPRDVEPVAVVQVAVRASAFERECLSVGRMSVAVAAGRRPPVLRPS